MNENKWPVGRGIVQGLQTQAEPSLGLTVVRFQIERKNAKGESLPSVSVEMRSKSFSGSIKNGDWVEVTDPWSSGEILYLKKITNLATKVLSKGTWGIRNAFRAYPRLNVLAIAATILFVVAGIILAVVSSRGANGLGPHDKATFSISESTARPGSHLTVSGTGWRAGETVDFRYGPDLIGKAVTDQSGSFSGVIINLPGDATGFFKTINAVGESSSVSREQPIEVLSG